MKLKIFSLFDAAASAFSAPFFMQNDGLAIRAFQDNVNAKEENNISLHPEQFTLFKLAEWDDKTGKFELLDTPLSLALGVELINDDKPRYTNLDLQKMSDNFKGDLAALSSEIKELAEHIYLKEEN